MGHDIIVAPATPMVSAALCVIRLSGEGVFGLVDKMLRNRSLADIAPNSTTYLTLYDEEKQVLDDCILTVYHSPKSFTGEDTVEINTHGSPYIVRSVINTILRHGARMAQPGEFTQRAFINGKMDLTQAEAVADLIATQSATQHELARRQMQGHLSSAIGDLRKELIHFASMIELENDFGEEDVSFADRDELQKLLDRVQTSVSNMRKSYAHGRAIKEGVSVALIGPPNAGKSTLLNTLLGEDKAIVTDIPGTTRDIIEDTIDIDGIVYRFIDTAGLRDTDDVIEQQGIERSMQAIEKAHIVAWMFEMPDEPISMIPVLRSISPALLDKPLILLLSKADLLDHTCHSYDMEEAVSTLTRRIPTIAISTKSGQGLDTLRKQLHDLVVASDIDPSLPIVSHLRHYEALGRASTSLDDCQLGLKDGVSSDFVAVDLRHALHHLSEITGEVSTDDLLDRIFREFCIGK